VGIIGTVYFIVALITMHFLRPDDIVRYGGNSIGFYSVGPYGSIFVAAFIALGLAGLALVLAFVVQLRRQGPYRQGLY